MSTRLQISEVLNYETSEMLYILKTKTGRIVSKATYFAYACERQEHPACVVENIAQQLYDNRKIKTVTLKQIRSFLSYTYKSLFFEIYKYEKENFKKKNIQINYIKSRRLYVLGFPYSQYSDCYKSVYFDFFLNSENYYVKNEIVFFEIRKEIFENFLSKKIKIIQ